MTRRPATARSPRGTLRLLQVGCFTSSFDRFLVAPVLFLVAEDLDTSLAAVGQAATVYFLAYGLMQSVWAVVSDRLGRVRTMRLAFALAALTGILSALAPSLLVLLVSRTLAGAAFAAAVPGALVYVGDTVPNDRRQAAMTDLMTGSALGMALSTLAAAVIGEFLHWRVAFALTGLVAAVLTVALRGVPEPHRSAATPFHRALGTVLSHRWALLVLSLAFGEGAVLLGFLTFLPATLQADGFGTALAGAVTTAYGVSTMLFAAVVKRLTARLSPARLTAVGAVCGALSYASLVVDQGVVGVLLGCVLLGAGRAFMHSTLQAWITEVVPSERATAVSLFSSLMFTGSSAAAAVGSLLLDGGHFAVLYALALAVMVPLGTVATVGRRSYARTEHTTRVRGR